MGKTNFAKPKFGFYGSTTVWQVVWVYYAVSQPCDEIVERLKGVEDVICQCCVL